MSEKTFASHPGNIELHPATYFGCYPQPLVIALVVGAIGALAVYLTNSIYAVLLIVAGGVPLYFKQAQASTYMKNGDTRPAIVLDPEGLVAVHADMTTGGPPVPAIKITTVPLKNAHGAPFKKGQRLTTVCTFYGPMESTQWEDVLPMPVVCATNDDKAIERSLSSIPEAGWRQLENAVANLKDDYSPRLIFL